MNCTVSNKRVFTSEFRVGISVDISSIYFNRLKFCSALYLNAGQQPSSQALFSRSRGWEEERPWEQGERAVVYSPNMSMYSVTPRVKGR